MWLISTGISPRWDPIREKEPVEGVRVTDKRYCEGKQCDVIWTLFQSIPNSNLPVCHCGPPPQKLNPNNMMDPHMLYCECEFSPIQFCLTLSTVEKFAHTFLDIYAFIILTTFFLTLDSLLRLFNLITSASSN